MSTIIIFSVILWVFLDRAKKLWCECSWGKWVTTGVAAAVGLLISFGYDLDLLIAVAAADVASIGGRIFAGLAIAGGSSVINELLAKLNMGESRLLIDAAESVEYTPSDTPETYHQPRDDISNEK